MVKKLSKVLKCVRHVKICLADLKGNVKDSHVSEEEFEEAV